MSLRLPQENNLLPKLAARINLASVGEEGETDQYSRFIYNVVVAAVVAKMVSGESVGSLGLWMWMGGSSEEKGKSL